MRRIATVIRVKPEKVDEYIRLHADPPPQVLATLRACNIANYSIHRHGDLLFGYYEYHGEDHEADQRKMAADPATREWWKLTDPCQEPLPTAAPSDWWSPMDQVFLME